MTQNKFWLVWSSNENPIMVISLMDAKLKALDLLKINPYRKVFITQPIKCFEGDIKIIETDLTLAQLETPKPKFKVGDKVNVFDEWSQQTALCHIVKIILENDSFSYEVGSDRGTDIKKEIYITHA